ncbi:MAG: dolichol kinase [Thermosphaera aggregans]|jgi:dolichol kinase|uniref:dolichol kinase n=1 Tax=Thermosphaera aggregans TaxID=54254 RepID=UPI003C0DFDC6
MLGGLSTEVLIKESIYTAILFIWVLIVVIPLTKFTYNVMVKKGATHIKAVYYNRKIIHILAGGVVSIMIPLLGYTTPLTIIPMLVLLFLATYIPHKTGKLLYWFQDPDNINEVNFIVMWGAVMITSWVVFKDWVYGVVPVAFMSFGDGITGIVRNALYDKRNKSWFGNLAMAIVTVPVGQIILGLPGAFAGLVASVVEHFEIHSKIDDNITVPLVSFLIILGFRIFGI